MGLGLRKVGVAGVSDKFHCLFEFDAAPIVF